MGQSRSGNTGDAILKKLKAITKSAKLPSAILFREMDNGIEMVLPSWAIGQTAGSARTANMQEDSAAFEAWALIVYHHYLEKQGVVRLSVDHAGSLPPFAAGRANGHYGRFLYRADKFAKQYASWFRLSPDIDGAVERFRIYLAEGKFENSMPVGEAGTNDKLENAIESGFVTEPGTLLLRSKAKASKFHLGEGAIYRQLPVGLFESASAKKSEGSVFTGGKSAIDLWTVSSDTISIFELKADNKMVGIITETMFYANYIYDMYIAKRPSFAAVKPSSKSTRGYRELDAAKDELKKIMAYFLTDALHPLITEEIIALMNDNGTPAIQYGNLSYGLKDSLIVK